MGNGGLVARMCSVIRTTKGFSWSLWRRSWRLATLFRTLPLQTATTWRTPLFTIDKERTCTASHPCISKVETSYIQSPNWLGA